jgi:hypothetical protein
MPDAVMLIVGGPDGVGVVVGAPVGVGADGAEVAVLPEQPAAAINTTREAIARNMASP